MCDAFVASWNLRKIQSARFMVEKRLALVEDNQSILDNCDGRTSTSSSQRECLRTKSLESDGIGGGLGGRDDEIRPVPSSKSLSGNGDKELTSS